MGSRAGGTRPAAASAARAPRDTDRPEGRPTLVRPLTALVGTGVIIVLMLAPSVKPWLDQRARIEQMRETVARDRRSVSAMETEHQRWSDPQYVKAQARERLHYVLPGETGYVVVDDVPRPPVPGETVEPEPDPEPAPQGTPTAARPWYVDLWRSLGRSGADGAGAGRSGNGAGTAGAAGNGSGNRNGGNGNGNGNRNGGNGDAAGNGNGTGNGNAVGNGAHKGAAEGKATR